MSEPSEFCRGAEVELTSVPRGREKRLKVGQIGVVLVGPDETEFNWVSVQFGKTGYPHLVSTRHLRLTGTVQPLDDELAPVEAPA